MVREIPLDLLLIVLSLFVFMALKQWLLPPRPKPSRR
jgi:Minimal binding motif of Hap4 for binding to Hap2/3/5